MGNRQVPSDPINFYSHYSRQNQIKLVAYPDNHLAVQLQLQSQQDYEMIELSAQRRKALNTYSTPFFITVSFVRKVGREDDIFCSPRNHTNIYAQIGYRYIEDQTLSSIIKVRKNIQNYFTIYQIQFLIKQFLVILRKLQQNKTFHGNLQSSTIYAIDIRQQEVSIGIIDSYFISQGLTNYELRLKYPDNTYYLSYQQLQSIKKDNTNYQPKQQDDSFGIGMTILELACLVKPIDLYDYRRLTIDESKLQGRLNNISLRYGQNIPNIIRMLLNGNKLENIQYLVLNNMNINRKNGKIFTSY